MKNISYSIFRDFIISDPDSYIEVLKTCLIKIKKYIGVNDHAFILAKKIDPLLSSIIPSEEKIEKVIKLNSNNKKALFIENENLIILNISKNSYFIFFNVNNNIIKDELIDELTEISDLISDILKKCDYLNKKKISDLKIISKRYVKDLLDRSSDMALIIDPESRKIIDINFNSEYFTGLSKDSLIGKDYLDLIVEDMHEIALKRLEIIKNQKYLTGEIIIKNPDQNLFVGVESILLEDGMIIEFMKDISNWLSIVKGLASSEYKFRRLFDNSPIGKEIYDQNFNLKKINEKALEIYGISSQTNMRDWNVLKEIVLNKEQLNDISEGKTVKIQYAFCPRIIKKTKGIDFVYKNNKYLKIFITSLNIEDWGGYSYFVQIQDDTAYYKKIKKLEKSNAFLNEKIKTDKRLMANLTHELRTPLNTIIGMSDLLKETQSIEEHKNYIKLLSRSADYLYSVINDILDLSKIESGNLVIENRIYNPRELIEDIVELFKYKSDEKKINIDFNCDKKIPKKIYGDTYRLRQILFNLIGNATKFTENGNIVVYVEKISKKLLQFCVKDDGIGINKNKINNIFKPFYQENTNTMHKYGGTGLGLSIVKSIVEKMGGDIWVESEVGKGSSFYFTYNYFEKGNDNMKNEINKIDYIEKINNLGKKMNVLIIDDSEENRFLIRTYLKKLKIDLKESSSGKDGLDLIKKEEFDIIILDIQMPEMDGFEVLHKIRELEIDKKRKEQKVIAVTAFAMKDDFMSIEKAGFNKYIPKPLKRRDFFKAIYDLIEE